MRGWAKLYEPRTKVTNAQAKDLFDSALRLDPDNIDAMLGKAWCIALDVTQRMVNVRRRGQKDGDQTN